MAGSAKDRDAETTSRNREISDRLSDLGKRLDETKTRRQPDQERLRPDPGGLALAIRAASELVAAVLVGGVIGWGFDWWLGTSPIFLLVFFLLGFAAGVLNVIRATQQTTSDKANTEHKP